MDLMNDAYASLRVRRDGDIVFVQMHRPDAANAIDTVLVDELSRVLTVCQADAKVVVLEGLPEVFCNGADFAAIRDRADAGASEGGQDPGALYDVWLQLAAGPYVSVAHVRGRANAGGVGFVAACDLVLAEDAASFSLSELLFGLMPACVLPFLVRRIGIARANALTLLTQPIGADQARDWGLVDICEADSANLLRKSLLRLRRLDRNGVARYKRYANGLAPSLVHARAAALDANAEVFGDPENIRRIARYVNTGRFPWEAEL